MKQFNLFFLFLATALLLVTGCKKDDPEPPEEEIITTLIYTLVPNNGGATATFRFLDLDDGSGPVITNGTLEANTTYTGSIELLNEQESPAEDITEEIMLEDEEHQFFFESGVAGLSVAYADTDGDGNPLGLTSTVTTGAAASGALKITLRHEPDKNADGVSDGNITNAGGETDIEVTFNVDVQ